MECDICHKDHDARRRPFLCAVDARNRIYEGRWNNLQLLMRNESLQEQIQQLLQGQKGKPSQATIDSSQALQSAAEDQTIRIIAAADRLRDDIKAAKDEIQSRKAAVKRRRDDIASVSAGLEDRRTRQDKEVQKSIQNLRSQWATSADEMARTRTFLCTEAARLYGLKRVKGGNGRQSYQLGKLPILELTSMNSLSPEAISTSLAHVCRILMLACDYLAIRLPAEIILPRRDDPRPTIFNLASSWNRQKSSGISTPLMANPSSSREHDAQHAPRPRPLSVDKPLPQLSKEDPSTYSYFLEGVTLLAYDISWLCYTQGLLVGDKGSFEDICNLGRNLYNLLVSPQPVGPNFPMPTPKTAHDGDAGTPNANENWIGRYSHGTTYHSLAGSEGTEVLRAFKLPSPMKLADKLKKCLAGDAPTQDWEVLDDDAWKVEEGQHQGVMVNTPRSEGDKNPSRPPDDGKQPPRSGQSGWMKVKSR